MIARSEMIVGILGLRTARRVNFKAPPGGNCHTHQALNNVQNRSDHFAICRLCHAHVKKLTWLSTLFSTASDEKLDRGLGTRLARELA